MSIAFDPHNKTVQRCIQAMALQEQGQPEKAAELLLQTWEQAADEFEKYLAAFFVAGSQSDAESRLQWLETCLELALKINDPATRSALSTLYDRIADCRELMHHQQQAAQDRELAIRYRGVIEDPGPFFHGTKAELRPGDRLLPGGQSNYKAGLVMNHIYFTGLVNGAGLAAALAKGSGQQRVYLVEPTGSFENDPNLTDKKFPGNPTRSYRSVHPLTVIAEITDWQYQTTEAIERWRQKLDNNKGEIIN